MTGRLINEALAKIRVAAENHDYDDHDDERKMMLHI